MAHYLVTGTEMKQYDKNTIEYFGVPSLVLMERAALALCREVQRRFPKECGKILVLCGAGNNGGDGFAAARMLHLAGYDVSFCFAMKQARMTHEADVQYQIAKKYGVPECVTAAKGRYAVIIDALFGIGLSRKIEGEAGRLLSRANEEPSFRIAADIASGISADTGQIFGTAFRADLTVAFGFAKIGQMLYPGAQYTGELVVADIGIDEKSFLGQVPVGRCFGRNNPKELLPMRMAHSHKGSYGKVLVAAGSAAMAGAAYFAAKAAYYSGCGLVRILTARENRGILLAKLPEAIVTEYSGADEAAAKMGECMDWADAVVIGPGLSQDEMAEKLVEQAAAHGTKKIVFDADALNILAQKKEWIGTQKKEWIFTPHPGEMSRLLGMKTEQIRADMPGTALDFSKKYGVTCVLKDARTVIGMADGKFVINATGNNGMATGGSGDVLAGFLAGFLAQGCSCEDAAALAVWLHGAAGDMAAEAFGMHSMLASDILEKLKEAVKDLCHS